VQPGVLSPQLTPASIVLLQELEAWDALLELVAGSLDDVARALAGEIALSAVHEDVADSLCAGTLPACWRALAPATDMRLAAWMAHLHARHAQYAQWVAAGRRPRVMWLAGLHAPDRLFAALVQATCRRRGWALEHCALSAAVVDFSSEQQQLDDPAADGEALPDGCFARGMCLEGASWDTTRGCLAPQALRQDLCALPLLKLAPIEAEHTRGGRSFRAPVYVTRSRCNAVGAGLAFEVDLATDEHASLWTLAGVAGILNAEDGAIENFYV